MNNVASKLPNVVSKMPDMSGAMKFLAALLGSGGRKKVDPRLLQPLTHPYTITATMIQAPWKYNWKNIWLMRYWTYVNIIFMIPFTVKMTSLVSSPEAKKAWAEKKALDHKKEHLHEWDVL